MSNGCERCPRKCCIDFKIGLELTNPQGLNEELRQHPYITKTSTDLIFFQSREKVVGVYNCVRFVKETGKCKDYKTKPRPSFCKSTGEVAIKGELMRPHASCTIRI